ncbi:hypothetical protein AALP_AA2G006500 [Arabis alpina]|uniref:WAT1-related protein n=1 Tax=Arabis alpina TaxID=50452 RepID=A0A087HEG9_ARAAL|nr:hypothetical protein AALP_AA2G006500 [Arabis alpina]
MDILTKAALNEGMSVYVLTVYRHGVATIAMAPFAFYFDRLTRPEMTKMIFLKITILAGMDILTKAALNEGFLAR